MIFKTRSPPKRFRRKRKKHEITCGKCGKKDNVDFHPRGTAPVLCTKCYKKAKAKGGGKTRET